VRPWTSMPGRAIRLSALLLTLIVGPNTRVERPATGTIERADGAK